jgi:hypothetical protein
VSLVEFKQLVTTAVAAHFPDAKISVEERRGIEIQIRVEIDETTLIDAYYSTATEKKSYALVRMGARVFGYDNFMFWHCHPAEDSQRHVPCPEPNPDQVLREMKENYALKA